MYIWLFVLPAVVLEVADVPQVAAALYVLAGLCAAWAVVCVVSAIKPQREYRRARYGDEHAAP